MGREKSGKFFEAAAAWMVLLLLTALVLGVGAVAWQRAAEKPDRFVITAVDGPDLGQALIVDQRSGDLYHWKQVADNPGGIKTVVVYQGQLHAGSSNGKTIIWTDGK